MWLRHRQAWQAELMWHMKIKMRRSRWLFNILHVVSKEPKKQHLWDWSDPQKLSSSVNEPLHAALRRHLSCRREARRSRLTGVKHPKRSSYRIISERGHVRGREPIFFSLDRLWHWVKASVSPLSTNRIARQRPGIKTRPTWRMSEVRPPVRFQIVLHEALWLAGDAGKRGGAWWAADQSLLLISEKKWTNYQNRQFNLKWVFFFYPVCVKLWGNWKFTWVIRFYVWGIFMSWHIYQLIILLSQFVLNRFWDINKIACLLLLNGVEVT